MPELRRTIRRISPEEHRFADEPWWPVFLALLVFAGFACGTVLAYLKFDAKDWFYNAATWLIVIVVVVVGCFISTIFLPPRAVRRSLQLAIVLNLLFHLLLLIASLEVSIFGPPYAGERPSTKRSPRREARVIPDYVSIRRSDVRERLRENERPVETETPVEAREITPEAPSAETREVSEEPTPNIPLPSTNKDASAESTSLPTTPSARRADSMAESGPAEAQSVRFSESASKLSRREVEKADSHVARPVEPLLDPGEAPKVEASTLLTPNNTEIARSEAKVSAAAASAPETEATRTDASSRADSSSVPTVAEASAPAAAKQPLASRSVDSAAAEAVRPRTEAMAESALSPQSVAAAQSESSAVPAASEVTSPSTGVASSSSRSQTPRAIASSLPVSESVSASGNLRRSIAESAPSVTMVAPAAESIAGSAESTELAPAPTGGVAQQSGRENPRQVASPSASEAPSGGQNLVASASNARNNRTSTAAPAESTSSASIPRASIASNTPRSPVNAEAPDVSGAGTTPSGEPTTPTQTSIAQGDSGVAGGGNGPNLDRSAPAGNSPAVLPSGAARREVATQSSTPGEGFESSSMANIRRSQTGASAPSTTLRADDASIGAVQGSDRVADLNATSSASLSQASAQGAPGATAASQGSLDVDLGPTQIVAEKGEGRGSGGGAPEISDRSFDTQSRPAFASSRSPGYVPSSLKADAAAGATSPMESAGAQGDGPKAESLQASQSGGSASQSLSSLAGREAPGSTSAAGNVASIAPGSRATGGDSPAPSAMSESAAGSPSSRRSTSTIPSLAGMKAEEIGGAPSAAGGEGEPRLAAASTSTGASAAEGDGAIGARPAAGPPAEGVAVSGGGSMRADAEAGPSGPSDGNAKALASRGDSSAAPTIGLKADEIELARNMPSDGTGNSGQGLTPSLGPGKGSDVARQGSDSLPALLSAPEGVGGLGAEVGPDAGINRATAMKDSTNLDDSAVRLSRAIGALAPTTVASTMVPKEAFESRGERLAGKSQSPGGGGDGSPPPETEEAIERGLTFLASIQHRDGRWSLAMPGETTQITSDTAATSLALLSFQGAGYTHLEHKHKERVAAGLQFLVRNQKRNGDLYQSEDEISNQSAALYSHALATIALCEAYGMTQDPILKEPAQRALQFIVASQSPDRGGWRYIPQSSSDMSVSGWMLMALKSGQLAGLEVPEKGLVGVKKWLDLAQVRNSGGSLYVYNPFALDAQAHGREASLPMTSVGLLMRFYTGWNRDNPAMISGANYLRKSLPSMESRDTYYWYYGTQVMFHMGGEYWNEWNRALHPLLVGSQIKSGQLGGSWDPAYPVRDKWAAHGGRLYVTTMNLLSLEVYYRHLPLYEETSK